ncbi:3427_t:CDS:2, partial [Acaulospora colombiana]
GPDFSACVGNDYSALVSFSANIPDDELFCCGGSQCTSLSSGSCPLGINVADFQGECAKTGQSTFCVVKGYYNSLPSQLPANTLSRESTVPNKFSWLCCSDNSCTVPSNEVTITYTNGQYEAGTNCATGQYSLICFADNGGWTCTGSIGSNIPNLLQPLGSCVEQVAINNPTSNTSTTPTNPTSVSTSTSTSIIGHSSIDSVSTSSYLAGQSSATQQQSPTETHTGSGNSKLSPGVVTGIFLVVNVAGSDFSSCVGGDYNALVSFASNVPDDEVFCCGGGQCTSLSSGNCPLPVNVANFQGQCAKIGQSTFCAVKGYSSSFSSLLPGQICGGIAGDAAATNNTVGTCPSYDAIGNTLSRKSTIPNKFSWLCCDNNSCDLPSSDEITITNTNNHYVANTNCAVGQYSFLCFADDGSWCCTGSHQYNQKLELPQL